MEYMEFSAKTLGEALMEASIKLETSSDNIDYDVIEKGSNGLFGIGGKPVKIRARVKHVDEELEEISSILNSVKTKEVTKNTGIDKKKESSVLPHQVEKIAVDFLTKVFDAMSLEVQINIEVNVEESTIDIDLVGKDMGILIGKRGQTLDSLQYLVSLVVNKESASYLRVKLDTENYRKRRKETLENLAKNIAFKVKKTRRSVSLEPMNPYERRVIHSALQNDKYITTKSEGEEPYRRVVVLLKKKY